MFGKLKRYFHEKKHGKNTYLVYSMGKVGSSTVTELMEKQYPFLPVFQIHFLSDNWIKKIIPSMPAYYHVNIPPSEVFLQFKNEHPENRLKIITLVREPVIRDISDVFENWRDFFKTSEIGDLKMELIMNRLHQHDFDYTLSWFDTEFKEWTGIDIYTQPFDKEKGYSIWKFDSFDVLCIKLEKLDHVLNSSMMDFCGLDLKVARNSNVSAQKNIRELYKETVSEFRLSEKQEHLIFDSRLVNHFYSENEIAKLRNKWVEHRKNEIP